MTGVVVVGGGAVVAVVAVVVAAVVVAVVGGVVGGVVAGTGDLTLSFLTMSINHAL